MADVANNPLIVRFNGYARQPAARQFALLIGLAASIAMAVGLVQWAMRPAYKPLAGAMAPEDTSQAIAALQAAGIDYSLDRRSGLIAVPAAAVQRARLALAGAGLPRADGVGFESLYREQEIGLSSFMEQARFHRALEAELARTIAAMHSVRAARVHLAVTRQSAFLRQREQPAASVLLNLYPGRALTERQLAGIVHLLASSVPNLDAEQVSVVDQQGKLLSRQGADPEMGYTQEQFRYTRQLERDYKRRILSILEPILGSGAVRAQVAAEVDFTRVERTEEAYSPDTRIRSEQTSQETSVQSSNGGVPGTLSNQPPVDTRVDTRQPGAAPAGAQPAAADPARPLRSSRQSVINYEMDKTISHVRETPGALRRLSIAVVLDYVESSAQDGSVSRAPLPAPRVEEITALVRETVGFDAQRGDTVSVISAPLVAPPALPPLAVETSLLEQDWLWPLVRALAVLGVLLVLIFAVLRPLIEFSAAPVAPAPRNLPGQAAAEGEAPDDQVTLGAPGATGQMGLPAGAAGYQQQLQMARSVAAGEPERAAYVVKNWVAEDG